MSSVAELARTRLREHREAFDRYERDCLKEVQVLEKKRQLYEEILRERKEKLAKFPERILLNVGGQLVKAEHSTLLKRESLLSEMLSSGKWQPDKEGRLFLDRDADKFNRVLDYLQSDTELRMTAEEIDELQFLWLYPEEEEDETMKGENKQNNERAQPTEKEIEMEYRETEKMISAVQREAEEYIEELRETVVLDVRGKQYMTTKKTLQKGGEHSMLSALTSDMWTPDTAEGYYIDRNSGTFAYVLDYLRAGRLDAAQKAAEELHYFGIVWQDSVQKRQAREKLQGKIWTEDARCTATFSGHTNTVCSLAELSNGQIVTGSWDKTVKIWTLDGTCTATYSGHRHPVLSVIGLSNGQIASGSADNTVKTWRSDGSCTASFFGHADSVTSVIQLRNGHIATSSQDKTVKIWTQYGTCTATFSGHTSAVNSVTELSNGLIASCSEDKTVKIWTQDGTCTATLSGHTKSIHSVTELSNGQIATGSADNTVKIWTQDGTCTATFSGHTNLVNSVTQLSNGQIATGSEDKTVKIWTLDGTCTSTLSGHERNVQFAIELSNGQIASASADNTVKLWINARLMKKRNG
ncbi:hypothetical protein PROFUN_09052 [Planoprotostelium fungivorum]|uniref:BTB domain-containing protein n=1 Tax=Planoprotostelium fungivorum TaxID=1890364 RepID=A0A2P6NID8_9EUKA|nr:hypothetical protein PROFUN_09052 [Planoprotostelium fungivorum]